MRYKSPSFFYSFARAGEIPVAGQVYVIDATPAQCAALAKNFRLEAVNGFHATLTVTPRGKAGLAVHGTLQAEIVYECVVTLEPFAAKINEKIDVVYDPPGKSLKAIDVHAENNDAPEVLVNGVADLGLLAQEFFALALDPYPRKPGAMFVLAANDNAGAHVLGR